MRFMDTYMAYTKQILNSKRNLFMLLGFSLMKKLVWVVLIVATSALAQSENKHIRSGNEQYAEENYKEAEVDYMKALEKKPESAIGQYNLGGALYKQENYTDASKLFENIANTGKSDEDKADAFYNLGNSFLKDEKFQEAIESYKNSLRLNPDDDEARYNLEYARKMMQQQQQQQQNQDQNKDDQDKEDQEKKDDQQQQDQQQQDQQQQDQQQQDEQQNQENQQQDQQQKNQQQQNQPQPQQISKNDAERMLQALKDNENKTLEKVKLQQAQKTKAKKVEKDW